MKPITGRRGEQGFALVLAILSLMLLTFLGLTLAATTSTELQIATNYRWGRQAAYNAEAGIEIAKAVLRKVTDWNTLLPPSRANWTLTCDSTGTTCTTSYTYTPGSTNLGSSKDPDQKDEWMQPLRNFENSACDQVGNSMGFGPVLFDGTKAVQYRTTFFTNQTINGAVTVWIRRAMSTTTNENQFQDDSTGTKVVVVSEGIAPFQGDVFNDGSAAKALARSGKAQKILEFDLSRNLGSTDSAACGTYGGQSGGGSEGAGIGGCQGLTGGTSSIATN